MEEWILTHLSPDMPLVRPVLCRGQTRMEEWILTHLSPDMPLVRPVLCRGQTRREEWILTYLSPEMPLGLTSLMQGSDQDGGVDTHSSESRHAPGLTSSDASCWTRMEEWTPSCLSPEIPPGPTNPRQGSDQ